MVKKLWTALCIRLLLLEYKMNRSAHHNNWNNWLERAFILYGNTSSEITFKIYFAFASNRYTSYYNIVLFMREVSTIH